MANANQDPFKQSLSFHSFNKDKSQVAVSCNDAEVHIYATNGKPDSTKDWAKEPSAKLTEHTGWVSGIDWHPETNLLVTCGHDRNAYVWKEEEKGEWKPTLVLLRIHRAATDVKWSPCGKKFAVASGAKCVPVCHFEESNNWWISKMIKKHKSTVTSLAWSPDSKLLFTGACDFKARIFCAYIEGVDSAEDAAGYGAMFSKLSFDDKGFGNPVQEFDQTKAWVNGVAWSPGGKSVAWVGHGSTLHIATLGGDVQTICTTSMPFMHVIFLTDDLLVCVGFDNNPHVYRASGGTFAFDKKLDEEKGVEKKKAAGKPKAFGSAFAKFQQADSHGAAFGAKKKDDANAIKTFHTNTVTDVHDYGDGKTFTLSSLDGRLLTWQC